MQRATTFHDLLIQCPKIYTFVLYLQPGRKTQDEPQKKKGKKEEKEKETHKFCKCERVTTNSYLE